MFFVVDGDTPVPLLPSVVIEGCELLHGRMERRLSYPPVKPDDFGLVLVDQFGRPGQPIIQELLRGRHPALFGFVLWLGRPVLGPMVRDPDVGIKGHTLVEKPPVLGAMSGHPEVKAFSSNRLFEFSNHISWAFLAASHSVKPQSYMGKPSWCSATGTMYLAPDSPEQLSPLGSIKLLGLELGDEVLVSKLRLGPVGGHVVFEYRTVLLVHVAGIPFVPKPGHRIGPPVDKDSEFGIPVPLGNLVPFKRCPVGLKRTVGHHFIHGLNLGFHSGPRDGLFSRSTVCQPKDQQ